MKKYKPSQAPTLDLHAFKVADVVDAVDKFLIQYQNAPFVRIMTGKGTGQVRKVVVDYLKLGNYSWHFEPLPQGGRNEGVLVVPMSH